MMSCKTRSAESAISAPLTYFPRVGGTLFSPDQPDSDCAVPVTQTVHRPPALLHTSSPCERDCSLSESKVPALPQVGLPARPCPASGHRHEPVSHRWG